MQAAPGEGVLAAAAGMKKKKSRKQKGSQEAGDDRWFAVAAGAVALVAAGAIWFARSGQKS